MNTVLLDIQKKVAIVTIHRPDKRNALNYEVRNDLKETLHKIDAMEEIRALIITGSGDSFVAGADIAAMKEFSPEDAEASSKHGSDIFFFIENMRIPVIAAVNGWALGGGCELALSCDIRIASTNAVFGQSEIKIGIMPGYGATVRLPRLIGLARAKDLIFSGRTLTAIEAEAIGLVNKVLPEEALMDYVMKLAKELSEAPAAIYFAKRALNQAYDLTTGEALTLASKFYGDIYRTEDAREGISSYLEKRKPKFIGR